MKFSVLVNNYNYARFLPETLASVAAQTLPAHEIIVVDDGSLDDSLAVLAALQISHPNLRIHSQPNGGQLSAMRAGVSLATGDFCAFLDADDTWEPNHLAVAAHALFTHRDAGLYYSGHHETAGPPMYRSKWPAGPCGPFAALVSATGVRIGTITSALVLRKWLADTIYALTGGLEADWRIRADDVLLFAAALTGRIFMHDPSATVRYRIHASNAYVNGDHKQNEIAYRAGLERLFNICRTAGGISTARHFEHLVQELKTLPAEHRSPEALRRYRRAIRRSEAPLPSRLIAFFRSYRLSSHPLP